MSEISEQFGFDFYYCVWWIDNKHPSTTYDNIIPVQWLGISQKIGSDMCYWVLMVLGKVFACTLVQHVICTKQIDPYMKQWIVKFDENLEKWLDGTNFIDDVGNYFYVDNVNESNKSVDGDGYNTPTYEAYRDMISEQRPYQYNIDDVAYDKYIGSEVIMNVPGEGPMRVTVRYHVEDLYGMKVVTYHQDPLMDT